MLRLLDIFRHIHQHRPGTPAACDVEGLLDDPRKVAHVLDQEVVLRARTRDADDVGFLESIVADQRVDTWPEITTIGVESM